MRQTFTRVSLGEATQSILLTLMLLVGTGASLFANCDTRTVTNTVHCNSGKVYAIWLNNGNGGFHFAGDESNYSWQECDNGTAEFMASGLTNANQPGEILTVHLTFSDFTTNTPSGSPKNNVCGSTNANGWEYYTTTSGTITSNLHGTYTVTRMGPSFQLGNGANQTGAGFGASGWFHMHDGDGYWEKGDVNIMLSGGPVCTGQIDKLVLDNLGNGPDFELEDGGNYSTADFPSNYRFEAIASGDHESLKFTITGDLNANQTENYVPYSYPGGSGSGIELGTGNYTVNVKLYSENHLNGEVCDEITISFHVQDEPCTGKIDKLVLDNLGGGADFELEDGGMYSAADFPSSYRFEAIASGDHESLKFTITGDLNANQTENYVPYTYPGGSNSGINLQTGNYTVNVKLYSENHLNGEVCDERTFSFHVQGQPCTGQITSFKLNDLTGGPDIVINEGDMLMVDQLPTSFNFEAMTSGTVESVKFTLSGDQTDMHTENWVPYRYKGDNNPSNFGPGTYTFNIKAYSENHRQGELCDEVTITFHISDEICVNTVSGGTIGLGAGGFFAEEDICNECAVPVIQSNSEPTGGEGALETVWIKRSDSNALEDCINNFSELQPFNVGQIYDDFVSNGGFGVLSPQIASTSWEFVTDNDADQLTLTLDCLEASACFVRCARREGCVPFSGESNFVRIEVNADIEGGTIAVTPANNPASAPFLGGEVICASDPVPVIGTSIFDLNGDPVSSEGEPLEIVWLRSTNFGDCTAAFTELAPFNVGQLYNNFVAGGMTYPIIGTTSWEFAIDNDGNDLTLTLPSLDKSSCFVRCARAAGDVRFCAESSFATIQVDNCAPVGNPCTFSRCDDVITVNGTDIPGINAVKVIDADNPALPVIFSCGTFEAMQCTDPLNITLPSATGNYILVVVCDNYSHYDYIPSNCGGLLANDDDTNSEALRGAAGTAEPSTTPEATTPDFDLEVLDSKVAASELSVYPNPASSEVFIEATQFSGLNVEVQVLNNLGQQVQSIQLDALSAGPVRLEVTTYEDGLYYIRMIANGQDDLVQKFVVERK